MALNKSRIKFIAFVLFIVLCAVLARLPGVREILTLEAVNAHLQTLSELANAPYGPFAFVLAMIVIIVLHMPGLVLVILGGLVYNPWLGTFLSLLGAYIGTILTFLMARFFLRDFLAPKLEKSFLAKYAGHLEAHGIFITAILRMLMAMSPIVSWMAGISKLSVREYMIGNIIGLFPLVLLITLVVSRLRSIATMSDLFQAETLIPLIVFMAAVIAVFILKNRLKAKPSGKDKPAE